MGVRSYLAHAWNAIKAEDKTYGPHSWDIGPTYGQSPGQAPRSYISNDKTIVTSIYNRMALDATSLRPRHVRLDEEERYVEDIKSALNYCLKTRANIDQIAPAFFRDLYLTMFEEGYLAVVPVDTTLDPNQTSAFDVQTMRVGLIEEFKPSHVKVSIFDEAVGFRKSLWLKKDFVAVVYNPFFSVMNAPSSTFQRLVKKLRLLDVVDESAASGKLDLIVQLPYAIRSEDQKKMAAQRRSDISYQLKDSAYGIAQIGVNEKITQLNRPLENQLLAQIQYLIELLYTQLGLTPAVMNGTADEATMLNYYHRTVTPIVEEVCVAMMTAFLSKTAQTQGQSIEFYLDMFKFVPVKDWAEIVDKFTRSELASSNELRSHMGWKPSKDPKADELRNTNMPRKYTDMDGDGQPDAPAGDPEAVVNELDATFEADLETLAQADTLDEFLDKFFAHNYDAEYARQYYLRNRKLKGRDKGQEDQKFDPRDKKPPRDKQERDTPTMKGRVNALQDRIGSKLGPQRQRAIEALAEKARAELEGLTEEFRQWVDSHPKAKDEERFAKRADLIKRKDKIVSDLRAAVQQIARQAESTNRVRTGTEPRPSTN